MMPTPADTPAPAGAQAAAFAALDREILAAHAAGDRMRLMALYRDAGAAVEAAGDIERACFCYTYAYVYALELGERDVAQNLWQRLAAHGREA